MVDLKFFTFAILVGIVSSQTATYPTRHYEEIGCTKVTNQPVLQYNCPFISKTLKPDKCYYGGKAIEVSKSLDVPGLPCWKYCICEKGMNQTCPGSAGFVCPVIDCFEFMMPPDTTQQCIWQHSHDECCSTGKVCGEEELNALPTCCDGTTKYKLGQVFYPENKCQKCICEKTKANPALAQFNCQNIKCAIGINDESSYQKCGPVYFENRDCCPISWQCPNQNEDIIVKNTCPDKHNRKCHYGNKILNFGDKIKFKNDKCLECSCQVPPLVSCTRKAVCNP